MNSSGMYTSLLGVKGYFIFMLGYIHSIVVPVILLSSHFQLFEKKLPRKLCINYDLIFTF